MGPRALPSSSECLALGCVVAVKKFDKLLLGRHQAWVLKWVRELVRVQGDVRRVAGGSAALCARVQGEGGVPGVTPCPVPSLGSLSLRGKGSSGVFAGRFIPHKLRVWTPVPQRDPRPQGLRPLLAQGYLS